MIPSQDAVMRDYKIDMVFPQMIELNQPWSIGVPGQELDIHFAMGLMCHVCRDTFCFHRFRQVDATY